MMSSRAACRRSILACCFVASVRSLKSLELLQQTNECDEEHGQCGPGFEPEGETYRIGLQGKPICQHARLSQKREGDVDRQTERRSEKTDASADDDYCQNPNCDQIQAAAACHTQARKTGNGVGVRDQDSFALTVNRSSGSQYKYVPATTLVGGNIVIHSK